MIKISNLLKLLLTLSESIKFLRMSGTLYKKLYDNIFKGKDRIILPYINHKLLNLYVKIPYSIEQKLNELGYLLIPGNYRYAQNTKYNNQQKSIGKILDTPLMKRKWLE